MSVFGPTYAGAYDELYSEKDYSGECDMIEALMALPGDAGRTRLLDLGCGTGNHTVPLAMRGHTVVGADLSEAMLVQAREKAAIAGVTGNTSFYQSDIRTLRLEGEKFDAALMMFAVLGYQQRDEDVRSALSSARACLLAGAPVIFDIWYGPGVMADKPGSRERVIEKGIERIVRRTNSTLDEARHICTVKFDLEIWRDGSKAREAHEEHIMRFFFPEELKLFASECGFVMDTLRNFPDWRQPVTETSWNAVGVLRAV